MGVGVGVGGIVWINYKKKKWIRCQRIGIFWIIASSMKTLLLNSVCLITGNFNSIFSFHIVGFFFFLKFCKYRRKRSEKSIMVITCGCCSGGVETDLSSGAVALSRQEKDGAEIECSQSRKRFFHFPKFLSVYIYFLVLNCKKWTQFIGCNWVTPFYVVCFLTSLRIDCNVGRVYYCAN